MIRRLMQWLLPPSRAASELAKHGAAMRRESERAKRLRVMNDLRRQLGLPEWRA